ncbi:hypothetical protein I302_100794 [Kwoniella bestiolae CBS 10118]|uniref:N-acetyltransferase domain-containing protein n=1 Tax=Kwoniella bestiolae CBS 10118 TaxID=1296100 RepID=A0A1B9G656_9TREE|nr:hypothetical protein I302_04167 [Kwoniella bestiolae CBS 10118]OCF26481.1 hypothetical protein I302_04167 [Kwoniella bestiolae CBS 10118]
MTHPPTEPTHADIPASGTSTPPISTPTTKPPNYEIRQGDIHDAQAISDLMIEVFTRSFGHSCTPEELVKYIESTLSLEPIKNDLNNPKCTWLLAYSSTTPSPEIKEVPNDMKTDAELLGIVQLTKDSYEPCLTLPHPIELQRIYLSYSAHGTGLARDLINLAEDRSRELGFKSIWLGAWEDNHRAKGFYKKMGYTIVGDHVFDIGGSKQRDEIMEKML